MKTVEELERPMICPFRSETHYEYVNLDGGAIVIDTQTETFPECYGGNVRYTSTKSGEVSIVHRLIRWGWNRRR